MPKKRRNRKKNPLAQTEAVSVRIKPHSRHPQAAKLLIGIIAGEYPNQPGTVLMEGVNAALEAHGDHHPIRDLVRAIHFYLLSSKGLTPNGGIVPAETCYVAGSAQRSVVAYTPEDPIFS